MATTLDLKSIKPHRNFTTSSSTSLVLTATVKSFKADVSFETLNGGQFTCLQFTCFVLSFRCFFCFCFLTLLHPAVDFFSHAVASVEKAVIATHLKAKVDKRAERYFICFSFSYIPLA